MGTQDEGRSLDRIRALAIWRGAPDIAPLSGGITNRNYLVRDGGRKFVVRLGEDIPAHQISRANELAASRAAHAAGISPAVIHHEPGVLVIDYIDGRAFTPEDVRLQSNLERIVALVKTCHREVGRHFRGAAMIFWVFHVVEDYAATLRAAGSPHVPALPGLLDKAARLEGAAGPYDIVFGQNDLLAGNILDDGERLWLIDWDYAGYNSPLFDLGGLASNNELSEAQELSMLETYFEGAVTAGLLRRYQAMKCASLLRETLWSMVSEIHSSIDFDYSAYTAENRARFERAYDLFLQG